MATLQKMADKLVSISMQYTLPETLSREISRLVSQLYFYADQAKNRANETGEPQ